MSKPLGIKGFLSWTLIRKTLLDKILKNKFFTVQLTIRSFLFSKKEKTLKMSKCLLRSRHKKLSSLNTMVHLLLRSNQYSVVFHPDLSFIVKNHPLMFLTLQKVSLQLSLLAKMAMTCTPLQNKDWRQSWSNVENPLIELQVWGEE